MLIIILAIDKTLYFQGIYFNILMACCFSRLPKLEKYNFHCDEFTLI